MTDWMSDEEATMYLSELIAGLAAADQSYVPKFGFHNPHSYRGIYADLAFEPTTGVSVGEMRECAQRALGATFEGYKGGEFVMDEYTDCWIAEWGRSNGDKIGRVLLAYLTGADVLR